ncbi:hypothetical protein [Glaciecola sp. MF2-115]|uniref:hypothetical protein n=1 Tax=Glaciecola sp. MF2-115 TaxID=3384827 RepID=UPI0039A276DD
MAEFFELVKNIAAKPSILKPQTHIFLLSHMRANTSLLGHILGEHDEINGYYEMHIGYYSWKSFLRQKSKYFAQHPKEVVKKNIFDKILHDGHGVTDYILKNSSSKFLISLRQPEITVRSTVAMFQKNLPNHEFTDPDVVTNYYINRADSLATYSEKLKSCYFYYDAEELIDNSNETLKRISEFLELNAPLKEKFSPKKLTGVGDGGDHTGNLMTGNIIKKTNKYDDIKLTENQINTLELKYSQVRKVLIKNSSSCR